MCVSESVQIYTYTYTDTLTCVHRLRVDAMVFCGPDSYGPTCATTCLAKSESTSGYTCDPETGRKICNEGTIAYRVGKSFKRLPHEMP